jgi:hypothetical protein
MRVFHCDHCEQPVFFENVRCVTCAHMLAFLPDLQVLGSLDPAGNETYRSPLARAQGRVYRLCENSTKHEVCNWAVSADDPNPFCLSCRLTRTLPNLEIEGAKKAWFTIETAKRRLVYTLLNLRLPVRSKVVDPKNGLAFEFLADAPGKPVLTGHENGVITISIAEADDSEREARRSKLHEPYRTMLGHLRHEVGHYYWDRIIAGTPLLEPCRAVFGDERQDYMAALKKHYDAGAPADWPSRHISAYATSHPWEDWAETWAHYLHMTDTLQIAAECGLSLKPRRRVDPALKTVPDPMNEDPKPFDRLIASWYPLTYVLNNLNRSMGVNDAYPFVLSTPVVEKLRFVHDAIAEAKPGVA